jgi:outer membrane protein assembly factor BamB
MTWKFKIRPGAIFLNAIAILAPLVGPDEPGGEAVQYWPQWRGPLCSGVAPHANPPLHWSETNNVKWKAPIPGEGDSTPIVWSNKVFILTAVPAGAPGDSRSEKPTQQFQFTVLCYNRQDGNVLWQKVARQEVPHEGHQENNTFASASPVTDGSIVCAYFGSRGMHCYDMDGNLKWEKDFGKMHTKNSFGEGSSPALYGDIIVMYWDQEGTDFIAAFDKNTGKELWRQPRDEGTGWSTPLIVDYAGRQQVIVNATRKVRSYDLATGKEVWECGGQTANAIPTPVAFDGVVYVTSGFRGSALEAIKMDHTGDVTGTDAILWSHNKDTPYVPSPLLVDNLIYVIDANNAILSCFDSLTGKPQFEHERLEGLYSVYASPVEAGDRVYVLGREGGCVVLKKGPAPEILATNKLDDPTDASMALVGREIFIRGHHNLYCIAAPEKPGAK